MRWEVWHSPVEPDLFAVVRVGPNTPPTVEMDGIGSTSEAEQIARDIAREHRTQRPPQLPRGHWGRWG